MFTIQSRVKFAWKIVFNDTQAFNVNVTLLHASTPLTFYPQNSNLYRKARIFKDFWMLHFDLIYSTRRV